MPASRTELRAPIAIVGAGPAGAIAATRLSRGGASVILFDGSGGREKPCGGGVTPRAVRETPEVAALAPRARRLARYRFASERDRAVHVICHEESLVFARRDLDQGLREAAEDAGASLIPCAAHKVEARDGGWVVEDARGRRHGASLLVGADGAGSLVRKTLLPRTHLPGMRCQVAYVEDGSVEENEIAFASGLPGYLWSFPRQDHVSVGICARGTRVPQAKLHAMLARYVAARHGRARTCDPHRIGGFIPSRPGGPVSGDVAGASFALLGDAAGLADPLTGEGIGQAMASGAALADAVLHGDLARYAAWVEDRIAPESSRAEAVASLFYSGPFIESMLWMASRSASIREILADLIRGAQGYRGLRQRLLGALPDAIAELARGGGGTPAVESL